LTMTNAPPAGCASLSVLKDVFLQIMTSLTLTMTSVKDADFVQRNALQMPSPWKRRRNK